jgi:hypothetical protein
MKITWGHPRTFGSEFIAPSTRALKREDGTVTLFTSREEGGDIIRTVADADGPVLQAFREGSDRCTLSEFPSFGEHYAYKVNDSVAKGKLTGFGGGALGGTLTERPRVLLRFPDQQDHGYVAGDLGIVHTNLMEVHSWIDGGVIGTPRTPDDVSLFLGEFAFVGNTFIWNAGSLSVSRQRIWSPSAGTSALLSAGNDATHGYGDLGTDGVQMVWNEGVRTDVSSVYPRLSLVVSPYATSSIGLSPRVLRSDFAGYGFGLSAWVVGCGYAARAGTLEPSKGNFVMATRVVRLSDGVVWDLPDTNQDVFAWRTPLALTCEELFALVETRPSGPASGFFNVARLRLDALGPGAQPPP